MENLVVKNVKITESTFWNVVDYIDWISSPDYKQAREKLKFLDETTLQELRKVSRGLQAILKAFIETREKSNELELLLSDDCLWDLTAHIVGCGREYYKHVFTTPLVLEIIKPVENFDYCFQR